MAVVNGYATLAALKAELGVGDSVDDTQLESALAAASRQIDGYCSRRFWQDATVVSRYFHPTSARLARLDDDVSTATGLVVATDDDGDGTWETTWTRDVDYVLEPLNAEHETPVRPWRVVRAIYTRSTFPILVDGRPGLKVTAKWGWPAVPDDVSRACLVQATQLHKAVDAPFGMVQSDLGVTTMRSRLHPQAEALLSPYRVMVSA